MIYPTARAIALAALGAPAALLAGLIAPDGWAIGGAVLVIAGRCDDATGCGQAVGLSCGVDIEPGGAAPGACDAGVGVDFDVAHPREIDHQAIVDDAVPGRVVAAATHGVRSFE